MNIDKLERLFSHLNDLALPTLVGTTNNEHLVVLADRHRSDRVLATEVLAQAGRHDLALDRGRGGKVRLAGLAAVVCEN